MPTIKTKPADKSVTSRTKPANFPEVLTLAEAASYLRLSEEEVIDLAQSHDLPGRSVGSHWRFLKSAIQQWLGAAASSRQARKKAQMALAGKYRDDTDLVQICEEAYRKRGR